MKGLLRTNLRSHARRYIATSLAVIISAAFVSACLVLGQALNHTLTGSMKAVYSGAAVTVEYAETEEGAGEGAGEGAESGASNGASGGGADSAASGASAAGENRTDLSAVADELRALPGVKSVGEDYIYFLKLSNNERRSSTVINAVLPEPLKQPRIKEGALPSKANEILLDQSTADLLEISVGDTLNAETGAKEAKKVELTLVGTTESRTGEMTSSAMTEEGLKSFEPLTPQRLLISGDNIPVLPNQASPGEDSAALTKAVQEKLASYSDLNVNSAEAAMNKELERGQVAGNASTAMLLIFPVIAAFVAAIVVGTTFQVILTQRRRELALLRAIGAKRGQVKSLVLREAAAIGAIASAIGVLLGALGCAAALAPMRVTDDFLSGVQLIPWVSMGITWLICVLFTMLLGLRPAIAVAGVDPIVALSPVDEGGAVARKKNWLRLGLGIIASAIGGGLITYSFIGNLDDKTLRFGIAFLGGLVALAGALLLFSVALPYITMAFGRVLTGPVGQMARGNTARNPGRTAATGTAIIIGVTLIMMMAVGASSLKATLTAEVNTQRPYDFGIISSEGPLTPELVDKIKKVEGFETTLEAHGTQGTIEAGEHLARTDVVLEGQPDLQPVAHSTVERLIGPDIIEVPEGSVPEGQMVKVCGPTGECTELKARPNELLPPNSATIQAEVLREIAPEDQVKTTMVIAKLAAGIDAEKVQSDIMSISNSLIVSGSAMERQMYSQIIDTILSVMVGMLGVSVLVALVGVTNTLSLSVHERTRENGLLRALGLTRGGMQRMLAFEAILIAATAAILGVALGTAFGAVAIMALPLELESTPLIVIPWEIVGVVLALAVLAALLASWIPGRRAAQTSPVEALAAL
ncbi:MAG: FtsX-like permease family protein [Actinomycetaceae bacterium]|nr:FtsX-like permease family protein [Actinomycetaceae bacterium]